MINQPEIPRFFSRHVAVAFQLALNGINGLAGMVHINLIKPLAKLQNFARLDFDIGRLALRAAATSGHPRYFLGTDSAPHPRHAKESACGCAGIFNSPYAIESYATVFEQEGTLDRLEDFASSFGPRFYGLPVNEERIVLRRQSLEVPPRLHLADASGSDHALVPFHAGQRLPWRCERGGQDGGA